MSYGLQVTMVGYGISWGFIGGQNELNHFLPPLPPCLFLLFQLDFAAAVIWVQWAGFLGVPPDDMGLAPSR